MCQPVVHDDDAMRAGRHHAAYFLQVQLHGLGVGALSVPDEFSLNVPIENSLIGV